VKSLNSAHVNPRRTISGALCFGRPPPVRRYLELFDACDRPVFAGDAGQFIALCELWRNVWLPRSCCVYRLVAHAISPASQSNHFNCQRAAIQSGTDFLRLFDYGARDDVGVASDTGQLVALDKPWRKIGLTHHRGVRRLCLLLVHASTPMNSIPSVMDAAPSRRAIGHGG
jgi:hypothetical protein